MNQHPGTLGQKLGMTQIYTADGTVIRCTAIQAGATIVGKRTMEKDGYSALVLGMGERKEKHTAKAQIESAKKAGAPLRKVVRELRCDEAFAAKYAIGATLPIDEIFEEGQHIDVQGITRGRGFTGVMRRWNFSGFRATHGTHEYRRHGGSIGTNMTPGRTLPGLKMPGQYGNETVSVLNVKVAKVMKEEGVLLIEGGVPGAKHSFVVVRGAVKKKNAGKKQASLVARSLRALAPAGLRAARALRVSGLARRSARGDAELNLLADEAEAALAAGVLAEREVELGGAEVGPRRLGEVELRVGALEEHEIADPMIAAGTDQEIGARRARRPHRVAEGLFGDARGVELARGGARGEPLRGAHDVLPRAVRDREAKQHAITAGRRLFEPPNRAAARGGERFDVADHLNARALIDELSALGDRKPLEEPVERLHLVGGALLVVEAQREHGERLDPRFAGGADDLANAIGAALVAGDAREPARLRPAAVAVEDDRDVSRDARGGARGGVEGRHPGSPEGATSKHHGGASQEECLGKRSKASVQRGILPR